MGGIRRLQGWASAAVGLWLSVAPAPTHAQAQAGGAYRLLLAPPRVEESLQPIARGHWLWLTQRLSDAGAPIQVADPLGKSDLTSLLSAARGAGVDLVVEADLRERDGRARVALRALDAATGKASAATLGEAPLPELGQASETALLELLPHLGLPGSALPEAAAPSLDELAAVGRAAEALDRGELWEAWQEVEGRLQPMAMRLRTELLDRVQQPGTPAIDRARILAAAGDGDAAWGLIAPHVEGDAQARAAEPRLLVAAAEVQIARRDPARARSFAESALLLRREDPDALVALGRALELAGDRAGALAALERAARAAPKSLRPVEQLAALQAETPAAGARSLLALATLQAERLEPERAARSLSRAVSLNPKLAGDAARLRGRIAARMGRGKEALAAYEEALRSGGSRDPEVLVGVGLARLRAGTPGAEEPLRLAVKLAPTQPEALRGLAELETGQGQNGEAAALLERALAAEPERGATRLALSRAVAATRGPEAALAVLTGAGAPEASDPATVEEIGGLERAAGHLDAARSTLEQALADWPESHQLRALLASVQRERGDAEAASELDAEVARSAGLAGFDAAGTEIDFDAPVLGFAAQVPSARKKQVALLGLREPTDWRTRLRSWLLPLRPDELAIEASLRRSLGAAFTLVPAEAPQAPYDAAFVEQLFAFESEASLDAEAISRVNQRLDTHAVFAARLVRSPAPIDDPDGALGACASGSRFDIELRMLSGQHRDVAGILADVVCIPEGLELAGTWNQRAFPVYAALVLLALFPALRGWGTLVVAIKLPPRRRGFLEIRIGRKPEPAQKNQPRRRKRDEGRLRRSLRSLSRFRKQMAGRETTFRWIPARKRGYVVTVRGALLDAMSDDVIGHFLEEQRVRVERGKLARLVFDYCPDECAVEVRVVSDGAPAHGARAALRGDPGSLRYARGGNAFFYLGVGQHTLVAGAGDRASERTIRIAELANAVPVLIDLGDASACMVRNCAEAVEPYLLGDFPTAARALAAAGEEISAHLMRGAHHQQRGDLEPAAAEFEAAGYFEAAAELRASNRDLGGSAALFEQAGDWHRAAETHRAAGAPLDAGRCYEQAYDYVQAIECYQEGGARDQALGLMEKGGSYLEAADLARELGDPDRAIRNLQLVDRRDTNWSEACRRMAELLAARGNFLVAAQKLAEAIESVGSGSATADLHAMHAELLERAGRPADAIRALETLRRLDPMREGVTERIAALSSAGEGTELTRAAPAAPAGAGSEAAPPEERRYEILGEVGRGGMGVVFKARDLRLGRLVALKRMPEHLRHNRVVADLFLREARSAAGLNHPNIVTVYDAGVEEGGYFISMELLEGLPLDQILERRGQLSVADTARLGMQAAAGLQYAHERRIVHRDIKTGNLFFTREKVVKIMDFGLAKTIEEVRRNSTMIGGTPYYMAPEQAAGEPVDARTDLYALGVTLFRMLTGSFPFRDGDLAYHHRHTPPPDPREIAVALPADVSELVLELLAKAPDARPADAAAVGTRLQEILRTASAR